MTLSLIYTVLGFLIFWTFAIVLIVFVAFALMTFIGMIVEYFKNNRDEF